MKKIALIKITFIFIFIILLWKVPKLKTLLKGVNNCFLKLYLFLDINYSH